MGDRYYNVVVLFGRFPFWVSSRPVVLHADRVPLERPFILASSHTSNYDVPTLIRHTPRKIDFLSTTELFRKRFVGWFFGNMNAFPLERSRSDPRAVRVILDRLKRGRVVGIFPEGRIRDERQSVVQGAPFRSGVAGIARLADVPIVPAVVVGGRAYDRIGNWAPLRRVRYGICYGEPIRVTRADDADGERQLADAWKRLYVEVRQAMGEAPPHVPSQVERAPLMAPSDRSQPA
jgi:1-acyl-sn-glycerol-3-phosphate acyltransferase